MDMAFKPKLNSNVKYKMNVEHLRPRTNKTRI